MTPLTLNISHTHHLRHKVADSNRISNPGETTVYGRHTTEDTGTDRNPAVTADLDLGTHDITGVIAPTQEATALPVVITPTDHTEAEVSVKDLTDPPGVIALGIVPITLDRLTDDHLIRNTIDATPTVGLQYTADVHHTDLYDLFP